MTVGQFLKGRAISKDTLYRKLRNFLAEEVGDRRRTSAEFPDRGFAVEIDREASTRSYEITDEAAFTRFAHRLTGYETLTNKDIEELIDAARIARDAAYQKNGYKLLTKSEGEWVHYDPEPTSWGYLSQILAKLE